ncbi:MAG: PQQ-binding-like beta-propeller repeat protein [Chthoniobacter sp.]|nr:PQQ-binding-like beta-propeller repeat protein [Chthoniobacter sp.]
MRILPCTLLLAATLSALAADSEPPKITHSMFIAGSQTAILAGDGTVLWQYPAGTRDGFVLPNGNLLLAVSKNKDYPGGAVVELTRDNKVVFEFKGTQAEVNTAQLLPNGNIMLTEAGDKPRLLEVDRSGKIVVEVPLQCQNTNHHMESRMARKLANGNYLVPQLFDKVVREYTPEGKIVWEYKTPEDLKEDWPFTAIRLPNGHTLINLTHSNTSVEVDQDGKVVWQLSNADLPTPLLKDPCGAQRLPNGNTVITSYGAGDQTVKMLEVTPEKKVVWTYEREQKGGIHEFQILDTNGVPLEGAPMK